MDRTNWHELVESLRGIEYQFGLINADAPVHRVEFEAGLSDAEVVAVEHRFGFTFPLDLRDFLQTALPRGPRFPDWRSGDETKLREWLDSPRLGILFDVEHNDIWLEGWGPRPQSLGDALAIASDLVLNAPRLIPIYAHRMIPDEPYEVGNPVYSVHQTDIIYYGYNLVDYFRNEFGLPGRESLPERARPIRFWSEIAV